MQQFVASCVCCKLAAAHVQQSSTTYRQRSAALHRQLQSRRLARICSQAKGTKHAKQARSRLHICATNELDRDCEKEDSRKYKRTVFNFKNWAAHRSTKRYSRHLLTILGSRIVRGLLRPLLIVTAVSSVVAMYETLLESGFLGLGAPSLSIEATAPFSLTSFALSLLLVFRTNTSYARWQEARSIWGGVTNRSRDIFRQALTFVPGNEPELVDMFKRWSIAYSKTLMCHLREEGDVKAELELLARQRRLQHNSAAQARWASAAAQLLRTWRHQINIIVPWRPLYDLLHASLRSSKASYEGVLILETKQSSLFSLVHRCRRFFPAGSAEEVWQELKPALQNLHTPTAQQALGWLSLFLPTHGLSQGEDGWNDRIADWMVLWESDAHNKFWRGQWMLMFAQVAKHDTQGLINWRPYMPRLFNQLQWAFQVPVGTASATPPFSSANSPVAMALFHGEVHTLATTAGKIIVYTLATTLSSPHTSGNPRLARSGSGKAPLQGQDPQGEDAPGVDVVLSQLEQLVDLLEQYFHPSNNGGWNKYLAKFVNSLCKHLNKRLAKEAAPPQGHISNGTGAVSGNGAVSCGRQHVSTETQRRVAQIILRMADKAQYSKDNTLAVAACSAFSQMAFIAPDLVLPLVQTRFQVALESVSATHQLVSAIHTFAICVRPLLLTGFAPNPDSAESGPVDAAEHKEAGAQAVAGAMMATLPGIDANDPRKTLACFRFYSVVLSSVGTLQSGPGSLPLYTEEWVEELLSRVFGILGNLEAPQTRSDHAAVQGNATSAASDSASFLLEGNSMFRPMMELLFARLPQDLQLHAIKQLARFVTTTTLASVTNETALICNAAAWAAPETGVELLLKPLLGKIEEEVKHDGTAGSGRMSKVQETTLDWLVGLAAATALHLGRAILPLKSQITRVLKALFAAPSKAGQGAASKLLSPVLGCLTARYPLDQFAPTPTDPTSGSASGSASDTAPQGEISKGSAQGGKYPKETIQGLLIQIEGAHHGLRSALPDFTSTNLPNPTGQKLALVGSAAPGIGGFEIRDATAKSLIAAAGFIGANDYETLGILLRVMSGMLSRGSHEFQEAMDSFSSWKSDQDVAFDPPLAALLFDQYQGGGKWGRRRPRWLMVERTYLHSLWRASQAAHKSQATSDHPSTPLDRVPPMHKALVQQLLHFSLHSYKGVHDLAPEVLDILRGAMREAASSSTVTASSKADDASAAETAKEDSVAQGAAALLRAQSLFRAVSRQPSALAGLVAALMAGSQYNSPKAQQAILDCYLMFALRFIRPPQLALAQASGGQYPDPIQKLFTDLLHVVGPDDDWAQDSIKEAVKVEVVKALEAQAGFGGALLEQMSHAHPQPGSANDGSVQSQMQKFMSMSRDDMVVKSLSASFDKMREWPFCVGSPEGIKDQAFLPRQARLVCVLADTAPAAVARALQGPVQEALQHGQDEDRARTCAAAEALSGLLASRTAFEVLPGSDGSAWDSWLKGAFQSALAVAPLDMAEAWAMAVRFAVNALAYTNPAGMHAVLQVIIQQPPQGAPSSAMVKRLKYIGQCLEELSSLAITGTDDTNPAAAYTALGERITLRPVVSAEAVRAGRRFQQQFLEELPGLMVRPGEALRHHLAWCGAILCDSLLWQAPCSSTSGHEAEVMEVESTAASGNSKPLLRSHVEDYCNIIVEGMKCGAAAVASDSTDRGSGSSTPTASMAPTGPTPMDSDQTILDSARGTSRATDSDSAPQGSAAANQADGLRAESDSVMEEASTIAQNVLQNGDASRQEDSEGLRNGAGPSLMPLLVRLLPYLLKTQELQTPELQPLSMESKAALALLKYLPLTPQVIPQVIETLSTSSHIEPWAARAAGLVFAQYFWFRHCFLLTTQQGEAVQQLVVSMLSDRKLEVQDLAAASLSGLLKGTTPAQFEQLRQHFLQKVNQMFPAKQRGKRPSLPPQKGSASSVNERHAALLGLRAFVLTSPYDVPAWLTDVLMALVKAAAEPAPIKKTVRNTLGEFRRTHEEAGLAEVKRLLTSDQWDAIQDVSSPATYFV
ncbi:hypothetical protein WJX79_003790 [Trebouxia sp. C0005]